MKASVILFLIIMLPLSLLGQQKDKLEKLWAAYHKTDQDIERIDCLIKIGREFNSNEGKTDSAKVIFEEALELANNGQDKLTIYRVLNQLGMTHVYLGNTVIADSLLNIALKGLKSLGNENGIASVYSHLSACYDLKGDFKKASHFSKVALDLYIE